MEFIKNNNNKTQTYIKVSQSLPSTGNDDDIIIIENNGIYQWKNNQWHLLISFIQMGEAPIIGEVKASIGSPGSDWLLLNGSSFSQTDYPELYSLLGTTTLPDFREVIPVGIGTNGTDTVVDHDVFTLGQKKDWNLQTHYHCKTECNHTHSIGINNTHTHTFGRWCPANVSCGIYSAQTCLGYLCCNTYNTTACVLDTVYMCCCTPSISIGNPSGGTAILRVNSYGVNFYIRAK